MLEYLEENSRDAKWMDALSAEIDKTADGYLGERLEVLKDFVLKPEDKTTGRAEDVKTIADLREKLEENPGIRTPVKIKVRGTLFPAALLSAGWWERKRAKNPLPIDWKNPLQKWLFKGFDLWAPSWDICWGAFDTKDPSKQYYIAQLTYGDEADSLPVIIGRERAMRLNDEFKNSWGGFEATVVGTLGRRSDFSDKLPANERRTEEDFYISVDDGDRTNGVIRLRSSTELYSGYLWKVLAPEEWYQKSPMLSLDQVYFVWEHTNFAAKEAVQYNLDSLAHKEELIAKQHPGSKLILLQKSHAVVPGECTWPIERFYEAYLTQGRMI
jgi:hypothetical protein